MPPKENRSRGARIRRLLSALAPLARVTPIHGCTAPCCRSPWLHDGPTSVYVGRRAADRLGWRHVSHGRI